MAWAKVDDGFWSHPKVMGLSLDAVGLWTLALSWSCHQRRDVVPSRFLGMVGADDATAKELVAAGLWDECDGGWVIHDWRDYQDASLSEKRAEAGAKGGKRSGQSRRSNTKQTDEANGKQTKQPDEANSEAGPALPGPSLPNPSNKPPSGVRPRATRLPDGWKPEAEPELQDQAKASGVNLYHELDKFRDYWAAQGGQKGTKLDWQATWRNWIRRAMEGMHGGKPPPAQTPACPDCGQELDAHDDETCRIVRVS